MGKYVRKTNRVRNKKNVNIKNADLSEVQFPKTKSRAHEMRSKIIFLARQGYKKFMTNTVRLENGEFSNPHPDHFPGWEYKDLIYDCTKLEVKTCNYDVIRLYARKE